jgi:hypothetical protein
LPQGGVKNVLQYQVSHSVRVTALTKANWLIPGIVAFVCDQAEKMSILFG